MKSGKFKTKKEHIISLWHAGRSYWAISVAVGCHENYVGEVVREYKKQTLNKQADKDFNDLVVAFTPSPQPDMVNSPPHYTTGGIEPIDYMQAKATPEEFTGHLRLTTIKYLSRVGMKGDALEDYKKAAWYLNRLINFLQTQ